MTKGTKSPPEGSLSARKTFILLQVRDQPYNRNHKERCEDESILFLAVGNTSGVPSEDGLDTES